MKKISVLLFIFTLSTSLLISCKNNTNDKTETAIEKKHHGPEGKRHEDDRKRPPKDGNRKRPPHGAERKGPHGGGPEQTKTLEEIGGYNIGDVATDFNLKDVDGAMVSLKGIKNAKGYIVTFTCNECPFSKLYEDRLIALHNTYAPKGYPVIAINPNSPENEKEGYKAMQDRAKQKAFPFSYLVDEGQKIYPQYGAVRTPHVFLLDKDRKVQYIGAIDDNSRSPKDVQIKYVENAIKALESGKKPNPNITKAIGCPVKASRG